jgi:hypothetical protein
MRPEKQPHTFEAPKQRTGVAGFLLDLTDHVRATYCHMTSRECVRSALHRHGRDAQIDKGRTADGAPMSALGQFLAQLERIRRAGGTYAELFAAVAAVHARVEELAGAAPRSLDKLDLEEERVSAMEDIAQMGRRVQMLQGALTIEELEKERGFRTTRAGLDLEFVQAINRAIAECKKGSMRMAGVA